MLLQGSRLCRHCKSFILEDIQSPVRAHFSFFHFPLYRGVPLGFRFKTFWITSLNFISGRLAFRVTRPKRKCEHLTFKWMDVAPNFVFLLLSSLKMSTPSPRRSLTGKMAPVCLRLDSHYFFFQLKKENCWRFWTTVDGGPSVAENFSFVLQAKDPREQVTGWARVIWPVGNLLLFCWQRPSFSVLKEVASINHAKGVGLGHHQVGILGDDIVLGYLESGSLTLTITILPKSPISAPL